jgi:hypothetical protein
MSKVPATYILGTSVVHTDAVASSGHAAVLVLLFHYFTISKQTNEKLVTPELCIFDIVA